MKLHLIPKPIYIGLYIVFGLSSHFMIVINKKTDRIGDDADNLLDKSFYPRICNLKQSYSSYDWRDFLMTPIGYGLWSCSLSNICLNGTGKNICMRWSSWKLLLHSLQYAKLTICKGKEEGMSKESRSTGWLTGCFLRLINYSQSYKTNFFSSFTARKEDLKPQKTDICQFGGTSH